ncbi:SDR family oxidoreductase [Amnibacterium sp.]|uniref:SDR family oxidoreductase n=1 Tax=Amnibacterium sp. TaxID=1872496 RepID=UPI0026131A8E|nr:NAD(P)H-binding protein [Amnibacterium sp.]MCU1472992.1 NAD-dependent epimerase/dehydratase family protein [Amnibacterium sp.]
MAAPMLVTGGTGNLGRRVVALLEAEGRDVRILSRHPGTDRPGVRHVAGDTVTGRGLDAAMTGAEVVLHLAGGPRGDDAAGRSVARSAGAAGVRHLVLISVVGADRMPIGYFRAKAAAEGAVAAGGTPFTILRAAQFHDFVHPVARALGRFPLVPAPRGLRFEPVDASEVAVRLVELALGDPAGRVPDLAGPDVLGFADLVAALRARLGRRTVHVPVPLAGRIGSAYRLGWNLAPAQATRGAITWSQYLDIRNAASERSVPLP